MDSRGLIMDCHAVQAPLAMTEKKANAARNDGKEALYKQDSRSCGGAVDFHRVQRILGFCDDFVRCEKKHKGVTLSGDLRAFLTLAQKRVKAESTSETKTESIKRSYK